MTRIGIFMLLLVVVGAIGFAMVAHVGRADGGDAVADNGGVVAASDDAAPAPTEPPLLVPVRGVARDALADSWADPRGGGTRVHHAIDIPAPVGTPVLAAAGGRIERLFTSDRGGLTVYERSADGSTVYYYAHLDRYAPGLAEGQSVAVGRAIASVGATGDADPATPQLHFEVHRMAPGDGWWQGREVDPYPLLRAGAG